jgi:hypothetical protein
LEISSVFIWIYVTNVFRDVAYQSSGKTFDKYAEDTMNYCGTASNGSLQDKLASLVHLVNEKEQQALQL